MPFGKAQIYLFSLQVWVEQAGFFGLSEATSLEGKTQISEQLYLVWKLIVSDPIHRGVA